MQEDLCVQAFPPMVRGGSAKPTFFFLTLTILIGGLTEIAIARNLEELGQTGDGMNVSMVNQRGALPKDPTLDWKAPPPKAMKQRNILDVTYDWVTDVFNHRKLQEKMLGRVVEEPARNYWLSQAAFQDAHVQFAQADPTFEALGSESMTALSEKISEQNAAVKQITQGLQFDFDLTSFWKGDPSAPRDNITYGLVLEDIAVERIDSIDSLGSSTSADVVTSWQAKPKWTIRPQEKTGETSYAVTPAAEPEGPFRMPTPRFTGNLVPQAATVSSGISTLPAMNLVMKQTQGYYEINIPVSPTVISERAEHRIKVPLVRDCSFSQRLDANLIPIESSLNQFLTYKGAPEVYLSYLHLDNQYATQWIYRGRGYGLSVIGKAPTDWQPTESLVGLRAEMAYQLEL